MNDLIKRKKDIEEEFDELIEMENDLNNTKSNITISTIGVLLKKFNSSIGELLEVFANKDNYDAKLKDAVESAIGQVADKFSQIQPPTINVAAPQLKFDIQPLQTIATKISEQNGTLINLINKFNNNQNEGLYRLISSLVEKQNAFLEKEVKQFDYTKQLNAIETSLSKKTTEWEATVKSRDSLGGIEKLIIKSKN